RYGRPALLPSFPTRRSSDLLCPRLPRQGGEIAAGESVQSLCDLQPIEAVAQPRLAVAGRDFGGDRVAADFVERALRARQVSRARDRKSTRLNSSHRTISYAV